jgi:hypothetical protein
MTKTQRQKRMKRALQRPARLPKAKGKGEVTNRIAAFVTMVNNRDTMEIGMQIVILI